jgi:hypothetical protein
MEVVFDDAAKMNSPSPHQYRCLENNLAITTAGDTAPDGVVCWDLCCRCQARGKNSSPMLCEARLSVQGPGIVWLGGAETKAALCGIHDPY